MKKRNNFHDKAFKQLMRQDIFAKAIIQQYFSTHELALFDVSSMELWNASYIEEKAINNQIESNKDKESHSDIVYKLKTTNGDDGYIIMLFEHQSHPEQLMPFRILEYAVLLMRQHLDQGHKKLPVIVPMVFYHGLQSPYPYSTDIFDCFENAALAKNYYLKPFNKMTPLSRPLTINFIERLKLTHCLNLLYC